MVKTTTTRCRAPSAVDAAVRAARSPAYAALERGWARGRLTTALTKAPHATRLAFVVALARRGRATDTRTV